MSMQDPLTDQEKIDFVYRYVIKKQRQELLESIWKWTIRAIIVTSMATLYFSMGNLLKWSAHPGAPAASGGSATQGLTKTISDLIKPIATDIAKDAARDAAKGTIQLPR